MPPELYIKFPRFMQLICLFELPLYDHIPDEASKSQSLSLSSRTSAIISLIAEPKELGAKSSPHAPRRNMPFWGSLLGNLDPAPAVICRRKITECRGSRRTWRWWRDLQKCRYRSIRTEKAANPRPPTTPGFSPAEQAFDTELQWKESGSSAHLLTQSEIQSLHRNTPSLTNQISLYTVKNCFTVKPHVLLIGRPP